MDALFMENFNVKWMMTGGTPMTQETSKSVSAIKQSDFPL